MSNSPEVSAILTTCGERPSFIVALGSLLAQDFASLEIVVVDDSIGASSWRNLPELAPFLKDERVRVVDFHQQRGCAAAKNAGLRAARGGWVCYLDDDNSYLPEKISAQHALATASGCPVVLCGLELRIGGRKRRRQVGATEFAGDDLILRAVADTNVLFHRRDSGVFWDESLKTVDDACFFQSLVAHYDLPKVPNLPRPLAIYNVHAGERANRDLERFYRGSRCLLIRWSRRYSPRAQRILLLRFVVAYSKYRRGGWGTLARTGVKLLAAGGPGEARTLLNAAAIKVPGISRWGVT